MANEIALFRNFGVSTPTAVTYSTPMNAFIGAGFTSSAGNTYFNAARFDQDVRLVIERKSRKTYRKQQLEIAFV